MNNNMDIYRNAEGYPDPTARDAITNMDSDYIRFRKLLKDIFEVCEDSGFHLEGRITVMDKKTGKVWK